MQRAIVELRRQAAWGLSRFSRSENGTVPLREPKAEGARCGVSLLEVLISVFVLAIGLLGLAALIPVGRYAIVETGKADRSAACGRAGLREIKIRGMLDPTTWVNYTANNSPIPNTPTQPDNTGRIALGGGATLSYGESFAIDPLCIAREAGNEQIAWFPYHPSDLNGQPLLADPPPLPNLPRMTRVTLTGLLLNTNPTTPSLPLADQVFTWHDDLLFEKPDDRDLRPVALSDATNRQQIDGNYSWMVTLTPALVESPLVVRSKQLYRVSVVVFYKRDLALPTDDDPTASERTVTANMLGGGYGGGDVKLTISDPVNNQPERFAQYLDVKENEWLMLCGGVPYTYVDANDNTVIGQRGVFRWYRIIAAGEVYEDPNNSDLICRDVTLAGPDWDLGWCYNPNNAGLEDLDNDGVIQNAEAALFDGVIGVYTTLVELDYNLLWGN